MKPMTCRSCSSNRIKIVVDLGMQPLANRLLTECQINETEPRHPLRLSICEECLLLQITDTVPPVELFAEYVYFSSVSDFLLQHVAKACSSHQERFGLNGGSFVVEVASNDGYLLRNFVAAGIPCLGIEPAANIAAVAEKRGVPTINRFFSTALASELKSQGRTADIIIAHNVMGHVPDTNDFVQGLATLLKPGGRVILEFPYARDMIDHAEFDTIYHEHVFYFTILALQPLFARHGLEIIDVERLAIHGGSLRIYAAHQGAHPIASSVTQVLAEEKACGMDRVDWYTRFGEQVLKIRTDLTALLAQLKSEGHSIAAYGASAKGSTLLNFCGLGGETIDFVVDRSPAKQGRRTPGTHLPIVPAEELAVRRPDYALLLTWNFAEEILQQQQPYRDLGGRFIIPLPEVRVV